MRSFSNESLKIDCQGETLLLHPERALYWPAQETLFVADVHVGKEHRFGRAGIAIPGGISDTVLSKLFTLCERCSAKRLIVLGDFMHSVPMADESWLATLSQLLDKHDYLSVEVIAGNHDRLAGQLLTDSRIIWHAEELQMQPFLLRHEPQVLNNEFILAGHIHPAWRLSQSRRSTIKAPIFWFREHYAVLPAFGDFTGGVIVDAKQATDTIYMVGTDCVIQVPLKKTAKTR